MEAINKTRLKPALIGEMAKQHPPRVVTNVSRKALAVSTLPMSKTLDRLACQQGFTNQACSRGLRSGARFVADVFGDGVYATRLSLGCFVRNGTQQNLPMCVLCALRASCTRVVPYLAAVSGRVRANFVPPLSAQALAFGQSFSPPHDTARLSLQHGPATLAPNQIHCPTTVAGTAAAMERVPPGNAPSSGRPRAAVTVRAHRLGATQRTADAIDGTQRRRPPRAAKPRPASLGKTTVAATF